MARVALPMPHPRVAAPSRPQGARPLPHTRPSSSPRPAPPSRPVEPARSASISLSERRSGVARLGLGWIAVSLLFLGALVSLYLVQVSSVTMTGYDLEQLELERQTWLARNQQLEVELAKRRSLAWADLQATSQLGMTRAERPIYLTVTPASEEQSAKTLTTDATVSGGEGPRRSTPGSRQVRPNTATLLDTLRAWLLTLQAARP